MNLMQMETAAMLHIVLTVPVTTVTMALFSILVTRRLTTYTPSTNTTTIDNSSDWIRLFPIHWSPFCQSIAFSAVPFGPSSSGEHQLSSAFTIPLTFAYNIPLATYMARWTSPSLTTTQLWTITSSRRLTHVSFHILLQCNFIWTLFIFLISMPSVAWKICFPAVRVHNRTYHPLRSPSTASR